MNNKRNTMVLLAVLVVVIAGAAVLYNALSVRVEPGSTLHPPEESATVDVAEGEAALAAGQGETEPAKMPAPDFTVVDGDGNEVKLSDFLGTPVVLNFWASWCPPCKAEMPGFDAACAQVGDDVAFLMVDMVDGQRETVEVGAAFIAKQGYTFPVYYDTTQEAAYRYGVSSIPTTLFIDREGYVVTGAIGMVSEENLRLGIEMISEGE